MKTKIRLFLKKSWNYIKPRLLDFWQLIKEIILLLFSAPIFLIFAIIGVIYSFLKHLYKKDYSATKHLRPIVRSATLVTDAFANAGAGELLNDLSKIDKSDKIKYGKWYQTISEVTGLRLLFVKDTKFRKILDKVLGKNHCIDAVRDENRFYYNYK